jgi:hypothetical protein
MFDGDDSVNISGTNRGVVIDLSAVYGDPIALPLVMVAVTGWLQELRATQGGGRQWIQVFDEAWGLLQHASLAATSSRLGSWDGRGAWRTCWSLTGCQTCGRRPTTGPPP